jgi:hypothetical protein
LYHGNTSSFYHEDASSGVSRLLTCQPSIQENVVLGLMFWLPAAGLGEMLLLHIKSGGKSYLVDPANCTTLKLL